MKSRRCMIGGIKMDVKQTDNGLLNDQLELDLEREETENRVAEEVDTGEIKEEKPQSAVSDKDLKTLSVGEWMLVILVFLLPVINIIVMAVWAFSSKGNVHRRNLSRASLLWIIILLIAYVVAMAIAGFTIVDLFSL